MSELPFHVTLLLMVTDRGEDDEHLQGAYVDAAAAQAEADSFNQRNGIRPWAPLWHYTHQVRLHTAEPEPVAAGVAARMLAGEHAPWRVAISTEPRAVHLVTHAPITPLDADSGMRLATALGAAFQDTDDE
jgi:hypothetical protein